MIPERAVKKELLTKVLEARLFYENTQAEKQKVVLEQKKQLAEMEVIKKEADIKNKKLEQLLALNKTQIGDLKRIIRDRNAEITKL